MCIATENAAQKFTSLDGVLGLAPSHWIGKKGRVNQREKKEQRKRKRKRRKKEKGKEREEGFSA